MSTMIFGAPRLERRRGIGAEEIGLQHGRDIAWHDDGVASRTPNEGIGKLLLLSKKKRRQEKKEEKEFFHGWDYRVCCNNVATHGTHGTNGTNGANGTDGTNGIRAKGGRTKSRQRKRPHAQCRSGRLEWVWHPASTRGQGYL